MYFRVLGPIEISVDDAAVAVGPPQRRAVLAALVVDAGDHVPVPTLMGRVWDETPPAGARTALHAHVTRIRRLLHQPEGSLAHLRFKGSGYVLDTDRERVDLHRLRRLLTRAEHPRCDDGGRVALLGEALGMWRGTPLADVPGEWAARVRHSVEQRLVGAAVDRALAVLRLGRPAEVIGELTDLVVRFPLVEPLVMVLMRALCATGRRAEALDCYAAARRQMIEQLGTEPGRDLRDLHEAVLRGELDQPVPGPVSPPASVVDEPRAGDRPAQLPLDVAGFTGREEELGWLDRVLDEAAGQRASAIAAIVGAPGMGKTAVAVRWAHRVAGRFPDGQLYVDLRGYDPGEPMPARQALARFLRALGVAGPATAGDTAELAARFRSHLAGRRMLVVLDNAASAEHVRPLLPGAGSCLAVVTSRDSLSGLVVREGAVRIGTDPMPLADAVLLLRRLIGERVAADPAMAAAMARSCGRLPLALRTAAELAARPGRQLAGLVADLADPARRLDLLDAGGDERCGLSAVFGWSYRRLGGAAAYAFRLLGRHTSPHFDAYVVAVLVQVDLGGAKQIIDTLVQAHLIVRHPPGRYTMPDLLRAYAARLPADRPAPGEAATGGS